MFPTHHLKLKPEYVQHYIICVGSSGRAQQIAKQLEIVESIANDRKMYCYVCLHQGIKITIVTHGMGPASMEIIVKEMKDLAEANGEMVTIIRIGTAGSLQTHVKGGDLVIGQAAIRDEDSSDVYVSKKVPAFADLDVTLALRQAAREMKFSHHVGLIHTKSGLGKEDRKAQNPRQQHNHAEMDEFKALGCLASSMEASVLFIMSLFNGQDLSKKSLVRSGVVLNVIGDEDNPFFATEPSADKAIQVVLRAIEILEAQRLVNTS